MLIEWRFAEGQLQQLAGLARELASIKVDVIIAPSAPAAQAADRAHQRTRYEFNPPVVSMGVVMIFSDVLADAVLSASSDAIIAADKQGIIRFWNPGAERIFGFTRGEAMGQSLDIIVPERLRKRHWNGYHHVMTSGESRYGDGDILAVPGINKDGARISVEFTIVSLRDRTGQLIGLAAIMRDVTKRFEEMRLMKQKLAQATKASA